MSDTYQNEPVLMSDVHLAKIDQTLQLILAALTPAKPAVKTTEKQRLYMRNYQRKKRLEAKLAKEAAKANGGEVHEPGLTA